MFSGRDVPRYLIPIMLLLTVSAVTASVSLVAYKEIILNPTHLPDADKIVSILGAGHSPGLAWPAGWVTPAFSAVGVFKTVKLNVGDGTGRYETVLACIANAGFFRVISAKPERGRLFNEEDSTEGALPVAIASGAFWSGHFGGPKKLSDARFFAAGQWVRIIGILPAGIDFPAHAAIYLPYPDQGLPFGWSLNERRSADDVSAGRDVVIARLRPGVTVAQADVMEKALLERMRKANTDPHRGFGVIGVRKLSDTITIFVKGQITTITAAGCFVALAALFSLIFLSFARAAELRKDIAIRVALGAGMARLAKRELIWWLRLGTLSAAAVVALTMLVLRIVRQLEGLAIPRLSDLHLDSSQTAWIVASTMTVAFSLSLPYLIACRGVEPVTPVLNRGEVLSHVTMRSSVGKIVSIGQLSLALALTALTLRVCVSYWRLTTTPPGINPSGVFVSDTIPSSSLNLGNPVAFTPGHGSAQDSHAESTRENQSSGITKSQKTSTDHNNAGSSHDGESPTPVLRRLFEGGLHSETDKDRTITAYAENQEILEAASDVMRQPDVSNMALIGPIPYEPTAGSGQFIQINGKPSERALPLFSVHGNVPAVLGMRVLTGRWFNTDEEKNGTNVVIVGDALSKQFFDGHAIGRRIVVEGTGDSVPRTIIGVVDDVVPNYGQGIGPAVYIPANPSTEGTFLTSLIVKMAPGVTRTPFPVRNLPGNLLQFQPWTSMTKMMSDAGATDRASAMVAGWFACLVLLLAAAGTYAVFWMITIQRQREMAIRICFGAFPSRVAVGMALNAAILAACAGVGGFLIEYALEHVLSSRIYQFPVFSGTTFLISFSVIAFATLLSVARPAMSILRISPAELLRDN